MAKTTFLFIGLVAIFWITNLEAVRPGGKNVITKRGVYYTKQSTKVMAKKFRTTCTRTGWFLAKRVRCRTIYFTAYEIVFKNVPKYRIIYVCRSGYKEVNGECKPDCSFECENGGSCVAADQCSCRSGWTGNHCQNAVCGYGCRNGGTCVTPDTCRCNTGWSGNSCQNAADNGENSNSAKDENKNSSESKDSGTKKGLYSLLALPVPLIILGFLVYKYLAKRRREATQGNPPQMTVNMNKICG